jgi:3-deoxy-D-manno-octulosonic-acid transferase
MPTSASFFVIGKRNVMSLSIFRLLYLLLEILCVLLSPLILLALWANRYWGALGFRSPDSGKGILIHAASVGEVNAVRPLVKALREQDPSRKVVMTCTTLSGVKQAASLGIETGLAVLDLPWLRKWQLKNIDPSLIVIVETEIWPNLLDQAALLGIPVVFVNARLSAKSLTKLERFHKTARALGRGIKAILAQTEQDAERFRQLLPAEVTLAGNLKYALDLSRYDNEALRQRYGYLPDDFIICLGSSRPGEESMLANLLPVLRIRIPHLKVVIAIRHPKRSREVKGLFPGCALYSELNGKSDSATEVLLVDTIGHLNEFYAICDIAIVGGSFTNFGGHNPLEPAYYGKAILIGPHNSSCAESVRNLAGCGAITVTDSPNLEKELLYLYGNDEQRHAMGKRAAECVAAGGHALEAHLRGLAPWLK